MITIIDFDGKPVDTYSKEEVIAMLEELQIEIEEKGIDLCNSGWYLNSNDIIQQKIDKLREGEF